jgi:CRISPR-associated protein Cas1
VSYHIVHVFSHGARLSLQRGQLVCLTEDKVRRTIPIQDLRAVVLAARGISLGNDAMAAILAADSVVLHSNAEYKPVGFSAPLPRIADHSAFLGQVRARGIFNERLWRMILPRKIGNQAACLHALGSRSAYLENATRGQNLHEGNCARHYWRKFFACIDHQGLRRRRETAAESNPNQLLNYGYAVISALCHRSLLVHGLLPQLGLHHRSRYRAIPLVHDFVEPFRAFVDWLMASHIKKCGTSMESWAKTVGQSLRDHRVDYGKTRIKLMDAIDKSASALARAYATGDPAQLWFPELCAEPNPC